MKYKSKEEIEIDFSRAINQALELEELAKQLSNMSRSQVNGALSLLEAAFKGENGSLLNKKSQVLPEDMFDTADDILKVARNIRTTADIVYRAEKKAASLCY